MFDPENIVRYEFNDHEELEPDEKGGWILAANYDKLLERLHSTEAALAALICDSPELATEIIRRRNLE